MIRETEAADLGCAVADFDRNELVVVPRPEKVLYPEYAAMVVSFGTGTVVSVEAPYVDWVRANPPGKHWYAYNWHFLSRLAMEIEGRGAKTVGRSVALGFAPAEEPRPQSLAAGFGLATRDRAWMEGWRKAAQFDNSIGDADEDDWFDRLAIGFVALTPEGEPAALATAADDANGRMEIGLDVRRPWRGQGLARPLVLAVTRWILDQGAVPYYTCGGANVRSHLVAESCGFRPLWTVTGIARETPGVNAPHPRADDTDS